MKIGLLSDTHGHMDDAILKYFSDRDEIWHAGDIGTEEIIFKLKAICPLRAVSGNIDGQNIRSLVPPLLSFSCEGIKVLIIHIGGYPGNYFPEARKLIKEYSPDLFICGHSHILKVMRDEQFQLLHMNPGAAGIHGFHKMRTLLRFDINEGKITDLEAIELGLRGKISS
ncbi:MAG: metallophosphoesterase [Bacteroidetes bacterium]|nr:MAG: metallophosphoesterase [Bacteroidota bacterium]REK08164.1 MAG: metallophosphoesterase [Bacteroidota bacterium]REK32369.1 MAG: metallophosphoesterase [Bacteroidota bacterium]REK49603.1 MAG: metallophosphoesterase [Bacteroidota bacterium]